MSRKLLALVLLATIAAPVQPALSEGGGDIPESVDASAFEEGLRPLSDEELGAERGGLRTPFGFDIGFGAVVTTLVNGEVAMETQLAWTDQGAVHSITAGSPMADLAQRAAGLGINVGQGDWTGTLVEGKGGGTAILHDLSQDRIASMILNTAEGVDVRQNIDIDLSISNLDQMQASLLAQQTQLQINDSVRAALVQAGLR